MNKISLAAALSILSLGGEVDLRGPVAQRVTIEPTPGWFWPGRLSDRPPCPNCGHRPADTEQANRRIAQQYDARGTPQLFSTESSR